MARAADPFNFSSSFSEDESTFDSFGDFGDFQSAQDGELTPTAGSWTLTSDPNASDEWSEGSDHTDEYEKDHSEYRSDAEEQLTTSDGAFSSIIDRGIHVQMNK